MSGIVGSYFNTRGSGVVAKLGTDGQVFTSTGAGLSQGFEAAAGGGKIGQVVQTVVSDTTNTTSTSYADISGMTVAITPVATSSKILVNVSASLGTDPNRAGELKLLRDSTQIAHGDADGDRSRVTFQCHGNDNENDLATQNMLYLDSPSSTSELTYKLQWFVESSGDGRLNYSNSVTDSALVGRTASTMTVMEVLA